jgi:hypothetical protein
MQLRSGKASRCTALIDIKHRWYLKHLQIRIIQPSNSQSRKHPSYKIIRTSAHTTVNAIFKLQHRDIMHSPRIDVAYAESIATCLAIEDHEECLCNPRWIEKDWSVELVEHLQRAQDDLENDSEWFSRNQGVNMSRSIVHGRACLEHGQHAERLHTLQMIRGDVRSDLVDPSCPNARNALALAAAGRRARKRS